MQDPSFSRFRLATIPNKLLAGKKARVTGRVAGDTVDATQVSRPVQKLDRTVTTERAVVCNLGSRGITIARHEHASPLAVLHRRHRWLDQPPSAGDHRLPR